MQHGHRNAEEAESEGHQVEQHHRARGRHHDGAQPLGDANDAEGIEREHRERRGEGEHHGLEDDAAAHCRVGRDALGNQRRDRSQEEPLQQRVGDRERRSQLRLEADHHRDDEAADSAAEHPGHGPAGIIDRELPRVGGRQRDGEQEEGGLRHRALHRHLGRKGAGLRLERRSAEDGVLQDRVV